MPLYRPEKTPPTNPAYDYVVDQLRQLYPVCNHRWAVGRDGVRVSWDEIVLQLRTDLSRQKTKKQAIDEDEKVHAKAPSREQLVDALALWQNNDRIQEEIRLVNSIAFAGKNTALDLFLEATTGKVDPLDKTVMEHWIWQIKRKMHDKDPQPHIVPVFVGAEGAGKSVAIHKLLEPIDALVELGADFSVFTDKREWRAFSDKYVFFMDEMVKAASSDSNALKNIITAKRKPQRVMGTTIRNELQQRASFIGASNEPVNLLIKDVNARRWYQIDTQATMNHELVNSIDYLAIWRGVDEAADVSPGAELWPQVRERQNTEMRYKHPIEVWLEEATVPGGRTSPMNAFTLYKAYEMLREPYVKTSEQQFRMHMTRMNVPKGRDHDGRFYQITVKDDPKFRLSKVV